MIYEPVHTMNNTVKPTVNSVKICHTYFHKKFHLTREFRVVSPPMRMADKTLELSDEYLES